MSRLNPPFAVLKERYRLTKIESTKETYHIILDISHLSLPYQVGDSLAVYADNDPELVEKLLSHLQMDGNTTIVHPRRKESMSLWKFLTQHANLSRITPAFRNLYDGNGGEDADLLDFLEGQGGKSGSVTDVVSAFAPLLPRLYSIASSSSVHPNEIHLTVTVSSYHHRGNKRWGVASHFLAHLAQKGTTPIPCYVQTTPHFTLPKDASIPIVMIGSGTGVAPFRAFMQERIEGKGSNWLFFGERERKYDFLYEPFWLSLVAQNKLLLDTAFSRDQANKIYVQHKLIERGKRVWDWIEQGAYLYVCGAADPMSKEVEKAIREIGETHGLLSPEESRAQIKKLRKEKRYLTDVY